MNYQDKVVFTFCAYLKNGYGSISFKSLFEGEHRPLDPFKYLKDNFSSELDNVEVFFNKLVENKIGYICYWEDNYPKKLQQLLNPPIIIFYKGDISLLKKGVMGIIGTRKHTDLGGANAASFTKELVRQYVIASGLAFGIDSIANKISLEIPGKSIAVVPGSLIKPHPHQNQWIYNKILDSGGLAISEFPFTTAIAKGSFVLRNRILAGIVDSLLVIESSEDGGSIITAKIAHSIETSIYAIPGNIDWKDYEGTNNLIKREMARLVTSPVDILKQENKIIISDPKFIPTTEEALVLHCIKTNGDLEAVCNKLDGKISFEMICDIMLNLEMNGIITRNISGTYRVI